MAQPVLIRRPEDVDSLPEGTPFVVEVPNEPEPPVEFAEAFFEVNDAVFSRMVRLRTGVEVPGVEVVVPADEGLEVEVTDTHVLITSPVDRTVEVSGDVRDGKVNLRAGRASQRKLTGEGTGQVIIDGQAWDVT